MASLQQTYSEFNQTEFMLISSRQKLSTLSESLELSIDNIPIKQVSTTKSLRILIDNNMAWHSHIQKDCLRHWLY